MARQAKVFIGADLSGFKKQMDDARNALQGLGKLNIPSGTENKLKSMFSGQLQKQVENFEKQIKSSQESIESLSKSSDKAMATDRVTKFINKIEDLKKKLSEVKGVQDQIATGKMPSMPGAGGGGASAGGGMLGGLGKALPFVTAGLGVMGAFSRATNMAQQRMPIRGLSTSGSAGGAETSQYGFTTEEVRQRRLEALRSSGGGTAEQADLIRRTSEQVERAYGVTQDQSLGLVGAGRKGGVTGAKDQNKLLANAIGAATAAGLTGSRIGEYLQSMTGYIQSMSEGVDVNTGSLNGFAAALGTMPFFKSDPARMFAALGGMNQTFTHGDPYQRAQWTRSILKNAPGSEPAGIEFRKSMGLFGEIPASTIKRLQQGGMDTRALETRPEDIIQSTFDELMKSSEGQTEGMRMTGFGQKLGIDAGATAEIYSRLREGERKGEPVNFKELSKIYSDAKMTPEEKAAKIMKTLDGSMVTLNQTIGALKDQIANNIGPLLAKIANALTSLVGGTQNAVEMGGGVGAAAIVGTAGLGAAKGIGGVAKGVGKGLAAAGKGASKLVPGAMKGAMAASKLGKGAAGLMKVGGKLSGRAAGAIPFVGKLVSIGFTIKDAYDIGSKLSNGEKVNWSDWGQLGLSAASIFDPTGLTSLASAGLGVADGMGYTDSSEDAGGGEMGPGAAGIPSATGVSTPNDKLPTGVKGESLSQPTGGGKVIPFPGQEANSQALSQNTAAIMQLTRAMTGGGGNFAARYPGGARTANMRSSAPGKR